MLSGMRIYCQNDRIIILLLVLRKISLNVIQRTTMRTVTTSGLLGIENLTSPDSLNTMTNVLISCWIGLMRIEGYWWSGNIQKGVEKNDWFVHNTFIAGYSIERRNYYAWMHYRIVFAMYVGNRLNEWWMGCRCWICAHSYWIAIPTRNLSNRQMRIWWYDDS